MGYPGYSLEEEQGSKLPGVRAALQEAAPALAGELQAMIHELIMAGFLAVDEQGNVVPNDGRSELWESTNHYQNQFSQGTVYGLTYVIPEAPSKSAA